MTEIDEFLSNSKLDTITKSVELRKQILDLVSEYTKVSHSSQPFIPGETLVPVSGRVYGDTELRMLVASSLDFWLTSGRFNDEFEKRLAQFLGVRFAMTTNSGSSANLLALSSLTSDWLGERALKIGDEVISVAAGFPTTINPILQNNLIPVFVDVEIPTYVIDPDLIEEAITEKTKAIMIAHTLGNPFNLKVVTQLAIKYNLWIIEDCCDALGSKYDGKLVGTFGDISTFSFYPAHHITMGEGGAVLTNNVQLKRIVESFRDWGRDCYCAPGKSNTCGKRFGWKLGDLPEGYDHKYTYSHAGYNLKITDMQAAIGIAQLEKLPEFITARKRNFEFLKDHLLHLEKFLILPDATQNSEPSWFGFPITISDESPFSREDLTRFLAEKKVDTRGLFGGNITKQPYFKNRKYRISGNLTNADRVLTRSFWIGVYPGLTEDILLYVINQIESFVKSNT